MLELLEVLSGILSVELALELILLVLVQVVDASKSLSQKVLVLVLAGLLEEGWLELLESSLVVPLEVVVVQGLLLQSMVGQFLE